MVGIQAGTEGERERGGEAEEREGIYNFYNIRYYLRPNP